MIFEEISWIRSNLHKFSPMLRQLALDWYRPFRFTPCFFQKYLKGMRKKFRKVPVIVQVRPKQDAVGADSIGDLIDDLLAIYDVIAKMTGCKIRVPLPLIHSFTARVDAKTLERLISLDEVVKVWYDDQVKSILDVAVPVTKAPALWQRNTTGKGIGVAIIDTGIHPHKDLEGRIVGFKDFVGKKTSAYDDNGHGTHVAGDIGSDGSKSEGRYQGAAPASNLIGVKVLNQFGSGALSTVIQGIEWCIRQKEALGIRVMNLSLGSKATQSYADDPVCQAVEKAWEQGIVVCVAAGNEGPQAGTIASPGIDPKAITVGAIDDKNTNEFGKYEVAGFSSRGPTVDGFLKPDLVSPGTNLISLRSPNSAIDRQNKSARVGKDYISLSGTSMATPVCAGIVALLLEQNPGLSPDRVKEVLMATAKPLEGQSETVQGKGLIDAEAAIKAL